jgi:hypothetical protein
VRGIVLCWIFETCGGLGVRLSEVCSAHSGSSSAGAGDGLCSCNTLRMAPRQATPGALNNYYEILRVVSERSKARLLISLAFT